MKFNKDLLYKYNRTIDILDKEQLIYFVIYNASEDSCIDGEKRLIEDKDDLHDFITFYHEDNLQDDVIYNKFCSIIKDIAEHDLDLINREIINCIEDGF